MQPAGAALAASTPVAVSRWSVRIAPSPEVATVTLVPSAPMAIAEGAVRSGADAQSAMPWPMQPEIPAGWVSSPPAGSRCRIEIALPEAEAT